MNLKNVIAGLLIMSTVLALSISTPAQLKTVSEGQVASFEVQITNNNANAETIFVTTDAETFVSISEPIFYLIAGESKTISVLAMTNGLAEGLHLIELNVSDQTVKLAVNVEETEQALRFESVYDEIKVEQGEYQDLRFILRNEGNERIRNIVIEGTIPTSLDAEYPSAIDLDANEIREIKVRITVPLDYPADEYEFIVKAGAGNVVAEDDVVLEVQETADLSDRLTTSVLMPWEAIKEDGTIKGYALTFKIKNNGISDVNNVNWKVTGMPESWKVTGTESFDIEGYDEKEVKITVIPTNFAETKVEFSLVKENEFISTEKVTFAGYKVGMNQTGMFLFGGSITTGLIIVALIVVALLFLRNKNAKSEEDEEQKTRKYLDELVKKAKAEKKK